MQQSVLLFTEHGEYLPFFNMLMFLHFAVLNFVATDKFFQIFVAFESSLWFIFIFFIYLFFWMICLLIKHSNVYGQICWHLIEAGYIVVPAEFLFLLRWYCKNKKYMWNWNRNLFPIKTNFFLYLAKTVWVLQMFSQISSWNVRVKEFWALEKHALITMQQIPSRRTSEK